MLGVPYFMLACGVWVVYRGLKATARKNQELAEAATRDPGAPT
jgi:hypothetical protein